MGFPEGGLGRQVTLKGAYTWQDLAPGSQPQFLATSLWAIGPCPGPSLVSSPTLPLWGFCSSHLLLRSRDAGPTLIYESYSVQILSILPRPSSDPASGGPSLQHQQDTLFLSEISSPLTSPHITSELPAPPGQGLEPSGGFWETGTS